MEYNKGTLIIMGICVTLGTICLLVGIITSEIEIRKHQLVEIYDNTNN